MNVLTLLVHGFNVRDGGIWTVGRFRPFFNKYGVCILLKYNWKFLFGTRFGNRDIAERLHETVMAAIASKEYDKIVVVGHSNGCAIIHVASELFNTPIDKAVYINPALERDLAPNNGVKAVDVWYSPSDKAVKNGRRLTRIQKKIGLKAKYRPWGDMGATGYTGDDKRIKSYNKEDRNTYPVISNKHSDVAKAEKLVYFGPLVAKTAVS